MKYSLLFKMKKSVNLLSVTSDSRKELLAFDTEKTIIDYSPRTTPNSELCFKIENFSNETYYPDFLEGFFATSNYASWKTSDTDIEFALNTNGIDFYFQKFIPSQILEKSWISLSGEPKLEYKKAITINPIADAFYNKNDDRLLFSNLDSLKRIFPGIEALYREATQNEVNEFLQNDLFDIAHYDHNKVGPANRKRIALLQNETTALSYALSNKNAFCNDLQNYCDNINIQNSNRIVIKTEEDLKNVLYALDERFYTTSIGQEKRLANSIIKIQT